MNDNKVHEMETFYSALADGTRLQLLNLMRRDEVCVCFFTEVLEASQPKISRHLAYLRKAGIVEARREGKWVHYRIRDFEDPAKTSLMTETLAWLGSQTKMEAQHRKLVKVCLSVDVPVTIERAPKPETLVERKVPAAQQDEIETFLL